MKVELRYPHFNVGSIVLMAAFTSFLLAGCAEIFGSEQPGSKSKETQEVSQSNPHSLQSSTSGESNVELVKKLEAKEEKLMRVQGNINSLKAQINKHNSASSAMFFRELASREAEYRILEQDVYYLRQQARK